MLPRSMLLATTYHAELARLYGTGSPHVSLLNRAFPFRLCPNCIAETRLLRRTVLLPHIMFCPLHHVALLRTCQCGAVLEAFHRQTLPFVRYVCGLDWGHLPRVRPTPERSQLEQKLLSYYDFFFTKGTPELLLSALQLIREKLKKEKMARVKLLDGKIKHVEHYELTKASLGYLVELLTSLDLPFPTS